MEQTSVPYHVAIIPDGNRRWARMKGLPVVEGHRRGADNFIKLSRRAKELGVRVLTLWGFSTENWQRTKEEVGNLMGLFEQLIDHQLKNAMKEETRIVHLGRKDRFSDTLKRKIEHAEKETRQNTQYTLVIALDYGGKDEILRAVNKMVSQIRKPGGQYEAPDLEQFLDTATLSHPNPDLIIRTSGEERLSGFMPWQSEYSELYFSPLLFPDFTPTELEKAVTEFSNRKRRFGK